MSGDRFFGFDLHERRTLQALGVGVEGEDSLQDQIDAVTTVNTAQAASLTAISNGNALSGSATYDPGSLADGAGVTTTVTVTGAALGDFAVASFSLDLQGITMTAYVSAADTVSVRFQNETTGAIDLASGTLRARVLQV